MTNNPKKSIEIQEYLVNEAKKDPEIAWSCCLLNFPDDEIWEDVSRTADLESFFCHRRWYHRMIFRAFVAIKRKTSIKKPFLFPATVRTIWVEGAKKATHRVECECT
jgi:hypothetical protein